LVSLSAFTPFGSFIDINACTLLYTVLAVKFATDLQKQKATEQAAADLYLAAPVEIQRVKLQKCQTEMQEFTAFLKRSILQTRLSLPENKVK